MMQYLEEKKFLNRWKKTDLIKCEILIKNTVYLHAKDKSENEAKAIKRSRFKRQHKGNYSCVDHHINTAAAHEMATLKANGSAPHEPEGPGRSVPASCQFTFILHDHSLSLVKRSSVHTHRRFLLYIQMFVWESCKWEGNDSALF